MKLIFLDIDGVLVTSRHLETNGLNRMEFDPTAVSNLNRVLMETDAQIVLSSNWRKEHSLDALKEIFRNNNVLNRLMGTTPISEELTTMRGEEIKRYIETFGKHNIHSFVILDDEENMLDLTEHYVQTDFRYGISREDTEKCIHILN